MKRLIRMLFAGVVAWCALTEAVQLFARIFFHTWVAGDWFLLFLASDSEELLKFATLYEGALALCCAIALFGFALAIVSLFVSRRVWWIMGAVFVLYVAQGVVRWGATWTPAYLAYDTVRGIRDYGRIVAAGRWTPADEAEAQAAAAKPETKTLPTLVYVIGESLTSSRMGVYGYPKNTTPSLAALATNGLAVLPPRHVTGSYTAKALQDLLVHENVSLVRTMRRRGYHPVLVSAQSHWERYCGVEQMVFAACERKRYLNDESPCVRHTDLELVGMARDELQSAQKPLLLIVHLLGSHFPYRERYPDYWSREDGMDDYDMSVRVTDMVVSELIRALPTGGILYFTSDHGESPNSGAHRNADDPDLWRVPNLVYPERAKEILESTPLFFGRKI